MQEVMCLIAPTASGKTALAYELYDTGKYYLISVDSALIYRDMNIGTAKPTMEELQRYPHALVDIINPNETYSVAQFVYDVKQHIDIAHQQQKIPLLVGGTMMYYMAILQGLADIPATLPEIRSQVNQMLAENGVEELYNYLKKVDLKLASKLNSTDAQRIGRAVEIFIQTGKPLSEWQAQSNFSLADNPNQRWKIYCITPDRKWLHDRIAKRLDMMWQQGFIEEVISLREKYYLTENMPSMRCVGYRQVFAYLNKFEKNEVFCNKINCSITISQPNLNIDGQCDARQIMQNQALYATRQLAKRQYTWLRKLTTLQKLNQQHVIKQFTTVIQAKQQLLE